MDTSVEQPRKDIKVDEGEIMTLYKAAMLEEEYQNKIINKEIVPTDLGYRFLNDSLLGGANKEDIILLAGLSGVGKSTLAIQIAYNIVTKNKNCRVLYLSFEVPGRKIAAKLISSNIFKSLKEMYQSDTPIFTKDKYEHFKNMPFHIVQTPLRVSVMENTIATYCEKYPNDRVHVVMDHTLLAEGRDGEDENEMLKNIAKMCNRQKTKHNIVYFLISQLNNAMLDPRRLNFAGGQYPNQTDIFGSKYLCHVANNIIAIISPSALNLPNNHYGIHQLPLGKIFKINNEKKYREYFYAFTFKARDGSQGIAPLVNLLEYSRLIELDEVNYKIFVDKYKI
jgi:KaiC/GvpD/RAD55 family RecA-like ATPase